MKTISHGDDFIRPLTHPISLMVTPIIGDRSELELAIYHGVISEYSYQWRWTKPYTGMLDSSDQTRFFMDL